eukprot:5157600-Amphidinium_carterae.1
MALVRKLGDVLVFPLATVFSLLKLFAERFLQRSRKSSESEHVKAKELHKTTCGMKYDNLLALILLALVLGCA